MRATIEIVISVQNPLKIKELLEQIKKISPVDITLPRDDKAIVASNCVLYKKKENLLHKHVNTQSSKQKYTNRIIIRDF
jgi:hypothetical protein